MAEDTTRQAEQVDADEEFNRKVRGFLQADGGDIEIVDIGGRDVTVRLRGACSGCPGAAYTLKMGVEAALRREIPDFGNLIPVD
jgi:Fe-S cluster biogenesis protein NfuA